MTRVYTANSIMDAHIVKGLLENAGIAAFVRGAYLQGGIGELPVLGLVTVEVADADRARAEALIESYDNADVEDSEDDMA